ncbi:hypothetical protein LUZ61_005031 [Rhynchospora tenuis]|uniref:non-specific serine/threonine protein kinase n=1 Tax=Rhynchospora tenuis TaxID=198213 RepID=A0AAD5ZNU2_9POAL|nr:hypothetical protein LUZ61_005031 [Rhynchospora tenuis]
MLVMAVLIVPPCNCLATVNYILSGNNGNILNTGDSISTFTDDGHTYQLIMQSDCNLVLYDNGSPVWASGSGGRGSDCLFQILPSGNLRIIADSGSGNTVWFTDNAVELSNYILLLQGDRNLVLYGGVKWATNTAS